MKRIPETELMEDPEQALAYGMADFEEPHSNFIKFLLSYCPLPGDIGAVLDLGCGTGDITFRVARSFPEAVVDAVDGSEAMLYHAREGLGKRPEFQGRIHFLHCKMEDFEPGKSYDLIVSNSLLHHIPDPARFWRDIKRLSGRGTFVFIMDLLRPGSTSEARRLFETHSPDEPDILKRDFYNSLLASFEIEEVKTQLHEAGLDNFTPERVSDRHLIVYGMRG